FAELSRSLACWLSCRRRTGRRCWRRWRRRPRRARARSSRDVGLTTRGLGRRRYLLPSPRCVGDDMNETTPNDGQPRRIDGAPLAVTREAVLADLLAYRRNSLRLD